jgi:Raf kinase inhibitor-like YbhB/YbcL family protein
MRHMVAVSVLIMSTLTACNGRAETQDGPAAATTSPVVTTTTTAPSPAPAPLAITSPAFADNAEIPAEYSCKGRNVPPPLRFENVPVGTEKLALVVDDPDAVGDLYVHWIVTGIPPSTTEIVDGALPEGARVGLNSGGQAAYLGPCPPTGTGVHHYRFQLYALSEPLTVAPTDPASQASRSIADAATATARMVGVFSG